MDSRSAQSAPASWLRAVPRDEPDDGELALAERDYPRAALRFREAIAALPAQRGLAARGALLVRLADAEQRAGHTAAAWSASREAAAIGRVLHEGALLADAVLATPPSGAGAWAAASEQHALGEEALGLLDAGEEERRQQLLALLSATADPWSGAVPARLAAGVSLDERFAELRARHEVLLHVRHAEQRLALAGEVGALAGVRDEQLAWAELWRAGALAQLGRRMELDAALMRLGNVVRRLREPAWDWRIGTALASLALLDGEFARSAELAAQAVQVAGESAGRDVHWIDLVIRSEIAIRTSTGLAQIDSELVAALEGAPFLAQGWRALVLLAAGEREQALGIWRALAPHLAELPETPVEWLVILHGFARLAVAAKDRPAAARLYALLLPVDGRQVVGDGQTPSGGPVALHLGRMAALLGDHPAARRHLTAAVREADGMHDRFHAAQARVALRQLGDAAVPLSARQLEIARLIAGGRSNRAIAGELHLSERTVEAHVSHMLTKLGASSRTGIAAWSVRRDAGDA